MPDYGRSTHWVRERYFGGVSVRIEDVEWVQLNATGVDSVKHTTASEIKIYRQTIERMCRLCVGLEDHQGGECWDATCPLRPVSPLPLACNAKTKAPILSDEVL